MSDPISNFIANLFTPAGFTDLLRFVVIIIEALYVIFSILVVRQVNLLNKSFKTESAGLFSMLSYVHLFLSFLLLLISISIR
ncbi:MAG: hypothetical protein ACD_22C00230G0006 [uncultured bacterium]|nr:MAG: hypothetical protein ACD_22C00230G0006 [uncultured bacterium]